MKKFISSVAVFMALSLSIAAKAENRWNVYGGGSISHLCETRASGSDKTYGWGGGAFLGGGYEINFNSHWSLTPQLELSFVNNGAYTSSKEFSFYHNHSQSIRTLNINIPVIASFRFPVSDNVGLRFGAGPYFQEAVAGWGYGYESDKRESLSGTFANRFNLGVVGEAAVETGSHLSYFFRTNYPFLKEGWVRKTITLSVGVKYTF